MSRSSHDRFLQQLIEYLVNQNGDRKSEFFKDACASHGFQPEDVCRMADKILSVMRSKSHRAKD